MIHAFDKLTDGKSNTFAEAAVWADDIKEYGATFFNDYHFTNVIYDPDQLFVGMTDKQRDINSINTVGWCMSVLLANKDHVTFERAFMARYLLHLVGDIHQPLHSTDMYNHEFSHGDLGGNLIHIETTKGEKANLHAFMDAMAGQQSMNGTRMERPLNDNGRAQIQSLATEIRKQYTPDYFGQKVHSESPHEWTIESFEYAVNDVYSFAIPTRKFNKEF